MKSKKSYRLFFLFLLLPLLLTGCIENEENRVEGEEYPAQVKEESREDIAGPLRIQAYFPFNQDLEYQFAGEGNEYASFIRKIIHVEDNFLQLTDNNGGTIVTSVYELDGKELRKVYSQEEFYSEENLIPEAKKNKGTGVVIIKAPLREGNSWENDGEKREIVAVNQTVELPAGTFHGVLKIKINYRESGATAYEYYAPNLGLIKKEYESEGFEVSSKLQSFALQKE